MTINYRQVDYAYKHCQELNGVVMSTKVDHGFLSAHDGSLLAIHCHPSVVGYRLRIASMGVFRGLKILKLDTNEKKIISTYQTGWDNRTGVHYKWTD